MAGFNTRYASPGTLPPVGGRRCSWAITGSNLDLATGSGSANFVAVYPFIVGSGFGVKYSDPGTLPVTECENALFSPSGVDMALCTRVSPYVLAYPWVSGSGFGVKYTDPLTLPVNYSDDVAFAPNGGTLATMSSNTSPWVGAYPWTPGVGFGVKYSAPSVAPPAKDGGEGSVTFTADGWTLLAAYTSNSTGNPGTILSAYPWGPGFGTKYADVTVPATFAVGDGVAATSTTGDVGLGGGGTGYFGVIALPFTAGSGFGARYPLSPGVAGLGTDVVFDGIGNAFGAINSAASSSVQAWAYTIGAGFGTKWTDAVGGGASGVGVAVAMGLVAGTALSTAPYLSVWGFTPAVTPGTPAACA